MGQGEAAAFYGIPTNTTASLMRWDGHTVPLNSHQQNHSGFLALHVLSHFPAACTLLCTF